MTEEKCPQLLAAALEFGTNYILDRPAALRLVSRRTKHLTDEYLFGLSLNICHLDFVDPESSLLAKVKRLCASHDEEIAEIDNEAIHKLFSLSLPNLQTVSLPNLNFTFPNPAFWGKLNWPEVTSLTFDSVCLPNNNFGERLLLGTLPKLEYLSTPGTLFDRDDGKRFAAAFPQLTYLKLADSIFKYGGLKALVQGLPKLRELDLSDSLGHLGDLAAASSTSITNLELFGGTLTARDAQRLTRASWLKKLSVCVACGCKIENAAAFNVLLKSFGAIKTLLIGTVHAASMLGFQNVALPHLTKLEIIGFHEDWDEGLEALCAASLPSLDWLMIQMNSNKRDASPPCDFQGLTPDTWPQLRRLVTRRLGISAKGMRNITPYLRQLHVLTLNAAGLDDSCAEALAEGFQFVGSSPLWSLEMVRNHITDNGFEDIIRAGVVSAPDIVKINFSSNPMGIESARLLALVEVYGGWPQVTILHLPQVDNQGLAMLAMTHENKWHLHKLEMDKMDEPVNLEIATALKLAYPRCIMVLDHDAENRHIYPLV